MQVNNVLADEILIAGTDGRAEVRSTLYEFREPRWVSVHWERQGRRLGPIALLDQHREDVGNIEHFQVTEFPPRTLNTEGEALSIERLGRFRRGPYTPSSFPRVLLPFASMLEIVDGITMFHLRLP